MAVGPLNSLKKMPQPPSAGWERMARNPKPTNHLRAPDGVAFPLPSRSRRSELGQVSQWMAQMALISLRFPENRQLGHHGGIL
jgi:hypothetical protein